MHDRRQATGRRLAALLSLLIAGCTASYYTRSADHEVEGVLDDFQSRTLADRASRVQQPDKPQSETPPKVDPNAPPPKQKIELDLKSALSMAVHGSRRYKTRRETLYLSGLGFTFTRFRYGPQFTSTVNYLWGDAKNADYTSSVSGGLGVTQLLPTNGTLALGGALTKSLNENATDEWSTSTNVSLTQPLLRGFGYARFRETLTQAERDLVYGVRDFELFREEFTIGIAEKFFQLVGQKRQIENAVADLDNAIFDQRKTEALRRVERNTDADVTNTRRRRLEVESQLADQQTSFRDAVQQFLIDLGLDPNTDVEFVESEPPFERVELDAKSAVEVAMHNRLDVQTEKDRIADAERQFELARDNLLPDMNLTASYSSSGASDRVRESLPSAYSRSAGVSLEIPLQTTERRNAWRQAEISIEQTRRGWDEYVDGIRSGVERELRQLTTLERQIEISEQSIQDEERGIIQFQLQLERGQIGSRELTDARRKLIQARNGLIDQRVSHLIKQLTLYEHLGLLFIDEEGVWSFGAPAPDAKGNGR